MLPFKPRDANKAFTAPKGQEDEVATLHVIEHEGALHSYWRPDEAELEALNAGGAVRLRVMGCGHPVVALDATLETIEELEAKEKTVRDDAWQV